jgi:hypothetical protein
VGGTEPGAGAVVGLMARITRPADEDTDMYEWARQRLAEMHESHRERLEAQIRGLQDTLAQREVPGARRLPAHAE